MSTADTQAQGRTAFARQVWADAYAKLTRADADARLLPGDLERLATAAYLTGREDEAIQAWTRAHRALVDDGEADRAARCAFWLSHNLLLAGEAAQSHGWLTRAEKLLGERDCVEQGYVLVIRALLELGQGDPAGSRDTSRRLTDIAVRFGDVDLTTFGLLCQGKALIELGSVAEAMELLDEAIVAIATREASSIVTGIVYCAALLACRRAFDLRRAQEWTAALSNWCDWQPDLVPFRGQCLVHRSEILQLRGDWPDAVRAVHDACERLADPLQPSIGMAFYQLGELQRLRGDLGAAEQAYREANNHGYEPQPGLALLRLAQGRTDAAAATIRRLMEHTPGASARNHVLAAGVEIMLAAGDVPTARTAAEELTRLAEERDTSLLRAEAAAATGKVQLADGDPRTALVTLRRALAAWQELDAPHLAAQTRVLAGLACRRLGDQDSATLEWEAARRTFESIGAARDLARLADVAEPKEHYKRADGLSRRERQILAYAAAGKTNREIADELVISDKTVERHLSNIYRKLGLHNRSAATAYAYRHGLV
jgi:DNA-binding CsgD family transcriptional regulator